MCHDNLFFSNLQVLQILKSEIRKTDSKFAVWFADWLKAAKEADAPKPNVCSLATVSPDGQPQVRMMALKEAPGSSPNETGFEFFLNLSSQTGASLKQSDAHASLAFYWPALDRQVRIEGTVEELKPDENDAYWKLRPRDAQLSAHVSAQGRKLDSKETMRERWDKATAEFEGKEVPRPSDWGGVRVKPLRYVFWASGGVDRLHDRVEFSRMNVSDAEWAVNRLFP